MGVLTSDVYPQKLLKKKNTVLVSKQVGYFGLPTHLPQLVMH